MTEFRHLLTAAYGLTSTEYFGSKPNSSLGKVTPSRDAEDGSSTSLLTASEGLPPSIQKNKGRLPQRGPHSSGPR
ncbi:uncharacterized [Tachysurus ichikawai]